MRSRTVDAADFPKTPVLRYENGKAVLPESYQDDIVHRMELSDYRVGDIDNWYPSVEQAKKLAQNAVENYEFIFWLVESNPDFAKRHNDARKILNQALIDAVVFEDTTPAKKRKKKE